MRYEAGFAPMAVCPGCEAVVLLPAEVDADSPPAICEVCGSDIPDERLAPPEAAPAAAGAMTATASEQGDAPAQPQRRYTRGGILKALSETVAEKGIAVIAKRTPPGLGD